MTMTDEQRARIRRWNELATALYALGVLMSSVGAAIVEQVKWEMLDDKVTDENLLT